MHAPVARLLGGVSLVLLAVACTNDDDGREPASSESQPSVAEAVEETPAGTGTPAPAKGEPGYESLPTCEGRKPATILGTPGDDRIVGTREDDVIVTFGGDDHVSGLRDKDRVCTGSGDDTVTNSARPWWIDLAAGDDRVSGIKGVSDIKGGTGDDRFTLPIDRFDIDAGPGNDTVRVVPGGPPDFPYGIAGNSPCPNYLAAVRPVHVDLLRGFARGQGHDRLINVHCVYGSRFDDRIIGSRYDDDIDPVGGSDEVWSLDGNDSVGDISYPGAADVFHLGAGNDNAMSGGGPDRVYGDSGNDFVETAGGADYLEGGEGNDVLHASYRCDGGNSGGAGTIDDLPNEVFGGPGDDHLTGDLGNDRIDGGTGIDEGHGGHEDGRIDWIESLERIVICETY